MVLNALALDPKRLWKGNWRWFSEEMLETCDIRKPTSEPLAGVEQVGLSFEEFLFLAECNGSNVRAFRSTESSLGKFRAAIATATTRTDLHVVASFSRKVLGQTGSGHYSPIGGYHAELDLALVLDVARFKYPPYWAPVSMLWKAICDIDEATGQGRGYYLMSKGKLASQVPSAAMSAVSNTTIFTPLSSACRIAVDKDSWSRLAEHFCSVLPLQLQKQYAEGKFSTADDSSTTSTSALAASSSPSSLDLRTSQIFREILLSLPVELSSIFMMYTHDLNERMVAQYQQAQHEKKGVPLLTEAGAEVVAGDECTATSSCPVHTSPLSIYHTLLPQHTPHIHAHSVPSVHALQPLLKAISATRMFEILSHAQIDFAALEAKRSVNATPTAASSYHLLAGSLEGELELATLLLFACPEQIFSHLPADIQAYISSLRSSSALPVDLQLEVRNLRAQMGILAEFCLCGASPNVRGNANPNIDPADEKDKQGLKHVAEELHATHDIIHQATSASATSSSSASASSSSTHTHPPGARGVSSSSILSTSSFPRVPASNPPHDPHSSSHHAGPFTSTSHVSHRFVSGSRSKRSAKTNVGAPKRENV